MLKQSKSPKALDLIVSWELETADGVVTGHHYLLDLSINRDTKNNPLHMVLLAPSVVKHDFSLSNLCQVPVKINLKNVSDEKITFVIQAVSDTGSLCFNWVGSTSIKVEALEPDCFVTLSLVASFLTPGCYNLNRFSLKINEVNKDLPRHLHQILIS